MEVQQVGVERVALAAAIAGVVQHPLMKGQDQFPAQHVGRDVGGPAAQQLHQRRGVVDVIAEPLRLAAALFLQSRLELELAD